jgi:hypothetical protein
MVSLDRHPVDVRGPLTGAFQHRQRLTSFARAFVHDGRLYVAESRDLGRTVLQVTSYPIPEGEFKTSGNTMKWGEFVFSGCSTCRAGRSKWKSHTVEELVALADVRQDA